ncbi:hypothetical protein GCM10011371_18710 [Novosphingobium marinum]|uniref:Uncharacterized protein n=1 Tax=Novosphingobium marinum TaxID=1514948 RepID=A0A7Y9XWP7_9SPHN|nr:hypothetical protein [Novosphingobium marinum]NYH95984.1 hypothetical protein [Novosphingobium marinum]GGC31565.1 hypothetical protein GCM10011371_18710 [Novosphingobium marinum]
MSDRLAIAATASILAMSLFVLSGSGSEAAAAGHGFDHASPQAATHGLPDLSLNLALPVIR